MLCQAGYSRPYGTPAIMRQLSLVITSLNEAITCLWKGGSDLNRRNGGCSPTPRLSATTLRTGLSRLSRLVHQMEPRHLATWSPTFRNLGVRRGNAPLSRGHNPTCLLKLPHNLVDRKGIEPSTPTLQGSVAPLEHGSPHKFWWGKRESNPQKLVSKTSAYTNSAISPHVFKELAGLKGLEPSITGLTTQGLNQLDYSPA